MKRLGAWMALLLALGAPRLGVLAQSDADPAKDDLIVQARQHAVAFRRDLPNFVVNQKVTRTQQISPSKDWRADQMLETELTYAASKGEQIKVLKVDGRPTKESELGAVGGMTSIGEFGAALELVFASNPSFRAGEHDELRGRDAVIYDFIAKNVRQETKKSMSGKTEASRLVDFSGRLWIDAAAKRVVRLEWAVGSFPSGSPVNLQEHSIDYDWATIEDQKYLLPVRAELLIGLTTYKMHLRNVIEFVNYRKWEGKIRIVDSSRT